MTTHTHVWTYASDGGSRVCASPWPHVESCGEKQVRGKDDEWVVEEEK